MDRLATLAFHYLYIHTYCIDEKIGQIINRRFVDIYPLTRVDFISLFLKGAAYTCFTLGGLTY